MFSSKNFVQTAQENVQQFFTFQPLHHRQLADNCATCVNIIYEGMDRGTLPLLSGQPTQGMTGSFLSYGLFQCIAHGEWSVEGG